MRLADMYEVSGLAGACAKAMIRDMNAKNVWEVVQAVRLHKGKLDPKVREDVVNCAKADETKLRALSRQLLLDSEKATALQNAITDAVLGDRALLDKIVAPNISTA